LMPDSHYSLTDLHLPERKKLTGLLKKISGIASVIVIIIGAAFLVQNLLIGSFTVLPLALAAFTLAAISVLSDKLISLLSAGAVFLIGILLLPEAIILGICFALMGTALILPRLKIDHRFRPSQLLILVVLIINTASVLGYVYQSISSSASLLITNPLYVSLIFIILCIAAAFHWPGRGFMGVFTTDTVSSLYALRLLIANISAIFILGFLILVGVESQFYNPRDAIALLAISVIVLSALLSWLNIKLLYKFELERFVMREELRIHNIGLKLGNEDLTVKMTELKEANKEYVGKLKYRDIISNLD
jgi:hypothetical protein